MDKETHATSRPCDASHTKRPHYGYLLALLTGASVVLAAGCAARKPRGPRATSAAFLDAAARHDVEAAYRLLDRDTQRAVGREGVKRLLQDEHKELGQLSKQLSSAQTRPKTTATFQAADGEQVVLVLEDGGYHLAHVGIVSDGAASPMDALAKLRVALLRRSYASLLPLLSKKTRTQVEAEVRALIDALQDPETLDVRSSGNRAVINFPDGHKVELEREDDVWWVDTLQ